MAKPITTAPGRNATIYWQQGDGENTVGEPAILLEVYSDSVNLEQEGNIIRLNYETIQELTKHLNRIFRHHKEAQ